MSINLWWIDGQGRNNLEVEGPDLIPILPDDVIIGFLETIPDARTSLTDLYPTMTPDGKARVDALLIACPNAMIQDPDPGIESDKFQHRSNTMGIVDPNRWR